MNNEQIYFCNLILFELKKHAPSYNITCYPAILSQAIIESKWGKSQLSSKYNNYFGLKCGSYWVGKSVNMTTHEEYNGNNVVIKDNFRVYDNLELGVKGYLDFINTKRYLNLKGVTDPQLYLELIKEDGYATSSNYVSTCMNVVTKYNLVRFCESNISPTKSNEEIAEEVIAGKWGSGASRREALTSAGYNYIVIQSIVNAKLGVPKKSNEEVATEIIKGLWGNGKERVDKIKNAGYNYDEIQKIVNKKLGK